MKKQLKSVVLVCEKKFGPAYTINRAYVGVPTPRVSKYPEINQDMEANLDVVLRDGGYPVYDVYRFTVTVASYADCIEIVPDHTYIRCGTSPLSGYTTCIAEGVTPVEARDIALAYLRML